MQAVHCGSHPVHAQKQSKKLSTKFGLGSQARSAKGMAVLGAEYTFSRA
jgi:hypothetical protein